MITLTNRVRRDRLSLAGGSYRGRVGPVGGKEKRKRVKMVEDA